MGKKGSKKAEEWKKGILYKQGQKCLFKGFKYKATYQHTSI